MHRYTKNCVTLKVKTNLDNIEKRRCCIIPKNTPDISNLRISEKIEKCNKFNELPAIMQQRPKPEVV